MSFFRFLSTALILNLFLNFTQTFGAERVQCEGENSKFKFEVISVSELKNDTELWDIYGASFPENERWKPEIIIEHNQNAINPGVMLRMTKDSKTIGFAEFIPLDDLPISYLAYIAVAKVKRKHGIGTQLFQCVQRENLRRQRADQLKSLGLTWEIERPAVANFDEWFDRTKVFFFYINQGAKMLMSDYFMPPLRAGESKVDMHLMVLPADDTPLETISLNEVRNALYKKIYPDFWKSRNPI